MESLEALGLRGRIKTLESTPPLFGAPGLKEVLSFNEQGNLVERIEAYRSDGREYYRVTNRYNESGVRISTEIRKDGKLDSQIAIKSNERGDSVEQVTTGADGKRISTKYSYKYDSSGRIVETVMTLSDPIIGSGFIITMGLPPGDYRSLTTYDPSGRVVNSKWFFPGFSTPFTNTTVVFNEKRQKVEETNHGDDPKPRIMKDFYKYNVNGDVIEIGHYESIIESNVEAVRDRFKVIDNKGTVQNGELISDKPNMILWNVTVCDYAYDPVGNWTKKTCKWRTRELKTFVPTGYPVQRNITYYK